jgi:hypothetical protein
MNQTFRDIARATDSRTLICALTPCAAFNDKTPVLVPEHAGVALHLVAGNLNSFVLDYVVRQKLRADPNYLRFRGFGVLRGLGDSWRPVFFALGVGGAEGDEVNISVKISSKARSAGLGGALARSWSP